MTPDISLEDMQSRLLAAIMRKPEAGGADMFLNGGQLDASACLALYQRSYQLRLRYCLAEQFPATRHALGEDLFADFADEYLSACPSTSYTLYDLGNHFSDWIECSRPDKHQPDQEREGWIDFMIDLAHYESALFRLYDAPGHEGKPWPSADSPDEELRLQPCLVQAQYRYPVAAYYHAVRAGKADRIPAPLPSNVVLLRRNYLTTTYPVSVFHYRFLECVAERGNVAAGLKAIAGEMSRPLSAVTRSWQEEVRQAWIEAGFFIQQRPLSCL